LCNSSISDDSSPIDNHDYHFTSSILFYSVLSLFYDNMPHLSTSTSLLSTFSTTTCQAQLSSRTHSAHCSPLQLDLRSTVQLANHVRRVASKSVRSQFIKQTARYSSPLPTSTPYCDADMASHISSIITNKSFS